MIAILGPSGTGKSTLRHLCMREFFGHADQWGLGRIPVVEVYPALSSNAFFNSRSLADALHDRLNVPDLTWLGDPSKMPGWHAELLQEIARRSEQWQRLKRRQMTESQIWSAVKQCITARSCRFISLEQVTSLMVNRHNTEPATHLLNLLNIAEETQCMLILTGVHAAFRMWGTHSELRRRISPIWVGNYNPNTPGDELRFKRLLKTVGEGWPLVPQSLLVDMAADIMAATAGVIGEVEMLLDRAAVLARVEGNDVIRKRHLTTSYYNVHDQENLWRDVDDFWQVAVGADVNKRAAHVTALWSKQRVTGATQT